MTERAENLSMAGFIGFGFDQRMILSQVSAVVFIIVTVLIYVLPGGRESFADVRGNGGIGENIVAPPQVPVSTSDPDQDCSPIWNPPHPSPS